MTFPNTLSVINKLSLFMLAIMFLMEEMDKYNVIRKCFNESTKWLNVQNENRERSL